MTNYLEQPWKTCKAETGRNLFSQEREKYSLYGQTGNISGLKKKKIMQSINYRTPGAGPTCSHKQVLLLYAVV